MKKTLFVLAGCVALLGLSAVEGAAPARAASQDTFQFAPPPFPILNLRAVDAQQSAGLTFISMKAGDLTFGAGAFGGARTVKKWDNGGLSMGGDVLLIGGSGKISGSNISLFGFGFDGKPNLYFDLYGHDEDDFSLPFYFGPHLSGNLMTGSFTTTFCSAYNLNGTCKTYSSNLTVITINSFYYGWQAGLQAGINLGDAVKFVPYIDFSQELGGSVSTSFSSTYGGSATTTQSISSLPVVPSPGFDLIFRTIGLSIGGASQAITSAAGSGKTKTVMFTLRWTKKFRSICGI